MLNEGRSLREIWRGPKFKYDSEVWPIPSEGMSADKIQCEVESILATQARKFDLLILHYGGHGSGDGKWYL